MKFAKAIKVSTPYWKYIIFLLERICNNERNAYGVVCKHFEEGRGKAFLYGRKSENQISRTTLKTLPGGLLRILA